MAGEHISYWQSLDPPIIETIKLDFCWVCSRMFGRDPVEFHHVVPQAYGGTNGPTVSICTACHTNCHEAALKLYKGNSSYAYSRYTNPTMIERCLYLATVIVNARRVHEKDPNKKVVFSCSFDADTHKKLKALVAHFKPTSQKKMIVAAINEMYKKYIGK